MAGAGSLPDYSYLLEDRDFLDWFWENATNVITSLNNHNFKNSSGKGANFLRREKDSPTVYGVVVRYEEHPSSTSTAVRSPSVTSLVEFFKKHKEYLCLLKVGFTNVSSDPANYFNRLETVQRKNGKRDQISDILFSLPINFVDVTNPRIVENKIRYQLGTRLDKETAKQLGLEEPTEWVISSIKLTTYVSKAILRVEKRKTGNDFQVLTTKVFSQHRQQLTELKKQLTSYLKEHFPPILYERYLALWTDICSIPSLNI